MIDLRDWRSTKEIESTKLGGKGGGEEKSQRQPWDSGQGSGETVLDVS